MVPPKNAFLSLRLPIFGSSYYQCFLYFGIAPSCQQFGEYVWMEYICCDWIYYANTWGMIVNWKGFFVPFGHRVGYCTFLKNNLCIGYMLPKIWGVCFIGIYMLGLDISRKQLGDDCNLKGIMSHLYIHFETIVARSSRTRSSNVAFGP